MNSDTKGDDDPLQVNQDPYQMTLQKLNWLIFLQLGDILPKSNKLYDKMRPPKMAGMGTNYKELDWLEGKEMTVWLTDLINDCEIIRLKF